MGKEEVTCVFPGNQSNLAMQQYILDCYKKEISKIRDIKNIEAFFFFFNRDVLKL